MYGGPIGYSDKPATAGGSGTVTSVAMTGDNVVFSTAVTGSPITTSGTLVPVLKTQTANTVFAGPTTGVAATPTFRTLVAADIPSGSTNYIFNQTGQQASSNFNISGAGVIGTNLTISGLTAVSVPYIGTAGLVSQDNANFAWDATNHTLILGSNAIVTAAGNKLRIPVAATASANYGTVSIGSAPFDGTTSGFFVGNGVANGGTHVAINAVGTFVGNYVDFQLAGVRAFSITYLGDLMVHSLINLGQGAAAQSQNTIFGTGCMTSNTSGNTNTGMGFNVFASASFNASNNACFGGMAGKMITTGGANAIFGKDAGTAITQGADNTAIGFAALTNITTGTENTAVGSRAGFGGFATGISRGIYIGKDAGYYDTASDSLYISSVANTTQVNANGSRATSIIYGKMSTTQASQTLQLNCKTWTGLGATAAVTPTAFVHIAVGQSTATNGALKYTTAYPSLTGISVATTNNLFSKTAHGLVANQIVVFTALDSATGFSLVTLYYVIAANLTANAFNVSATRGGASITVTGNSAGTGIALTPYSQLLATAEQGDLATDGISLYYTNQDTSRQELPLIQQNRVVTQFDKTTDTTAAAITGLTATVVAGRTYRFEAILYVDANVTGGSKFSISGVTTSATAIIYEIILTDNTTLANTITSRQTGLAGAAGQAGSTAGICTIVGTITVNAGGTLTPFFGQNASTGTSSVLVGSTFVVTQIQ